MTVQEYQQLARRTAKPNQLSTDMLLEGALGLNGEAGEVSDMLKKSLYQGHTLDLDELVNELGDVLWYIALISDAIGVQLESVMCLNIDKLKARYPEGFSEEASVNRIV